MATIGSGTGNLHQNGHPGRNESGAGAQPGAVGEPHPTILAGAHQAEACPLFVAELEAAQQEYVVAKIAEFFN